MTETHEEFFKRTEDHRIAATFYNCHHSFTVEEMYQAFKARLIAETWGPAEEKQASDILESVLVPRSDLDLLRQWFNAIQDIHPAYLSRADYVLAKDIYEALGMRVPQSVGEGACKKQP